MTDLMLVGNPRSALAHLAPIGLASILRDGGDRSARSWWNLDTARPHVRSSLSVDEIGQLVIRHACERAEDSWLTAKIAGGERVGMSLFSPRIKAAQLHHWGGYVAERDAWLAENQAALTSLDYRMLASLGQPAWWRCDPKDTRPDDGASRWEMKTRNRGEEFLANRLVPLTKIVSKRSVTDLIAGLTGDCVVDELSKNAPDSRTPTGLSIPGPTDSALAYVALWAFASLRTVYRSSDVSESVGMRPRHRVHPTVAFLPVFVRPVTPQHFASIAASRALDEVGGRREPEIAEYPGGAGEKDWLREQGVHAVAVFPVRKTGSTSAPERQILAGELSIL